MKKIFLAIKTFLEDRAILLPAVLIVGLGAFFLLGETVSSGSTGSYRKINADPIPALGREIEKSAWEVCQSVRVGAQAEPIHAFLNHIEQAGQQVTTVLQSSAKEALEHGQDALLLGDVEKTSRIVRKQVPAKGALSVGDVRKIRDNLTNMYRASSELNHAITQTHEQEISQALSHIAQSEKKRARLEIIALLCGFALILVLWEAQRHYKATASRARAAERVNALFAAALGTTRVGVLIRDMAGERRPVVFVNQAFTDMTGYDLQNVSEGTSEFLFGFDSDPESLAAYRSSLRWPEGKTLNVKLYRKDGKPFWCKWHLSPVFATDGLLTHYVSVLTDMTASRETQEELLEAKQQAEKASAVKTSFLAAMSHEIRTPINGILGLLRLIGERPLDSEQKHLLDIAVSSSRALHGIINDILDFAKIEAGKIDIYDETFNIRLLIESVVALSAPALAGKELRLEAEMASDFPVWVRGDEGRVRQILLNLVSNAVKFTEKGSVIVRARSMLAQEKEGRKSVLVRLEVIDTGIGIGAEDKNRLFEEFSQIDHSFTRRYGGSGLGLAICKKLVLLMEGEIGVDSQPGQGSKFWFMLPLELAAPPEGRAPSDLPTNLCPLQTATGEEKILLVEDNEVNRTVLGRYLQKSGFVYDEATDGKQALEKAKEKAYDLILMDVSMPEMDGMTATRYIRELDAHNAQVPIIALTAHALSGDREQCLAAGMSDYLAKPVEYQSLAGALERWLRIHPALARSEPSVSGQKLDFDQAILARMTQELGAESVGKVIDVFLDNAPGKAHALQSEDPVQAIDAAHALKSSAALCGLMRLSAAAEAIEHGYQTADTQARAVFLASAMEAFEIGRALLANYRREVLP